MTDSIPNAIRDEVRIQELKAADDRLYQELQPLYGRVSQLEAQRRVLRDEIEMREAEFRLVSTWETDPKYWYLAFGDYEYLLYKIDTVVKNMNQVLSGNRAWQRNSANRYVAPSGDGSRTAEMTIERNDDGWNAMHEGYLERIRNS